MRGRPVSIAAVTGGTVVTPTGLARTDLQIRDGKVAATADQLAAAARTWTPRAAMSCPAASTRIAI